MNDILARRARRATMGIALSVALVAGIAPATAIAAEVSPPIDAVALQTEDAAAAKEKAYAAMQEALKNLEAAKDAASSEKLAEIDDDIAAFQELYNKMMEQAAKWKEPLHAMQVSVDTAQAKYDEAHNRVSELQAKYEKELEALGGEKPSKAMEQHLKELRSEIMEAKTQESIVKWSLTNIGIGSRARKDRLISLMVRRREPKPTSMRKQPSEMRSSAI